MRNLYKYNSLYSPLLNFYLRNWNRKKTFDKTCNICNPVFSKIYALVVYTGTGKNVKPLKSLRFIKSVDVFGTYLDNDIVFNVFMFFILSVHY